MYEDDGGVGRSIALCGQSDDRRGRAVRRLKIKRLCVHVDDISRGKNLNESSEYVLD
jgi:hypothetical protein